MSSRKNPKERVRSGHEAVITQGTADSPSKYTSSEQPWSGQSLEPSKNLSDNVVGTSTAKVAVSCGHRYVPAKKSGYEFAKQQRHTLIGPLKQARHRTASTCCLSWSAGVGNNSFSKMYAYARCFVQCCTVLCNKSIDFVILTKAFFYSYAHIIQYICII